MTKKINIKSQILANQLILSIKPTLELLREEYLKNETDPSTFSAQAVSFFLQNSAILAADEMLGVLQLKNSEHLPDRLVVFIGEPVLLLQCLDKKNIDSEDLEEIQIPGKYLFSNFLQHHPNVLIFDPIVSTYCINMSMSRAFAYANADVSIASLFIEPQYTDPGLFSFCKTSSNSTTPSSTDSSSKPLFSIGSSFYTLFNKNKSDFSRNAAALHACPLASPDERSLTAQENESPLNFRSIF